MAAPSSGVVLPTIKPSPVETRNKAPMPLSVITRSSSRHLDVPSASFPPSPLPSSPTSKGTFSRQPSSYGLVQKRSFRTSPSSKALLRGASLFNLDPVTTSPISIPQPPGNGPGTITEFIRAYNAEHKAFASEAVEAEWMLSRAESTVSTQDMSILEGESLDPTHSAPSHLLTSVSLCVLDKVSQHFGDYSNLVSRVTGNLRRSIFCADVSPPMGAPDATRLDYYYGLEPYHWRARDLAKSLHTANATIAKLREELEQSRQDAVKAVEAARRDTEQKYEGPLRVAQNDTDKLRTKIIQLTSELKDMKLRYELGTPVERLTGFFGVMDHYDKLEFVRIVLKRLPDEAHAFAEFILEDIVPKEDFELSILHTAKARTDLSTAMVTNIVHQYILNKSNEEGGIRTILLSILEKFSEFAPLITASLVPRLKSQEDLVWAGRLLLRLDKDGSGASFKNSGATALEAEDESIGIPDTAVLKSAYSVLLQVLTVDECCSLMRLFLAAPKIRKVLEGPILMSFVVTLPPSVQWQLLQSLMSIVPTDEICTLITCSYHDHARGDTATSPRAGGKSSSLPQQQLSSMHKFLRKPPKSLQVPKFKVAGAVALVSECLDQKAIADRSDSSNNTSRQPLPDVVTFFFLGKYGLPSVCDGYSYAFVACISKNQTKSTRLRWFGRLLGVIDPPQYAPAMTDLVIYFLQHCFGSLTNPQFARGDTYVMLPTVLSALEKVHPTERAPMAGDTLWLKPETKSSLIKDIILISKSAASGMNIATSGPITSDSVVVFLDDVIMLIQDVWLEQMAANKVRFCELYHEFDTDGSNTLSFQEFSTLMRACCPDIATKLLLSLFHEVRELAGAGSGDCVSPEAFATMCQRHGYTPPYDIVSNEVDVTDENHK